MRTTILKAHKTIRGALLGALALAAMAVFLLSVGTTPAQASHLFTVISPHQGQQIDAGDTFLVQVQVSEDQEVAFVEWSLEDQSGFLTLNPFNGLYQAEVETDEDDFGTTVLSIRLVGPDGTGLPSVGADEAFVDLDIDEQRRRDDDAERQRRR